MTSRDDQPPPQEQPEYQPPQVETSIQCQIEDFCVLLKEEAQVEEARHSLSSSEEHSLGHESGHDPLVTLTYESQVWDCELC